jgi:hypothetical protein
VRLNEILSVPQAIDWDRDGTADERDEWIELYNAGDTAIDLGGWLLDDGDAETQVYQFPYGTVIGANEYLVLYRQETGIALDDGGAEVRLIDPMAQVVDSIVIGALDADTSYGLDLDGTWLNFPFPSPGKANVESMP